MVFFDIPSRSILRYQELYLLKGEEEDLQGRRSLPASSREVPPSFAEQRDEPLSVMSVSIQERPTHPPV